MQIVISKVADIFLATPVLFKVIPMTVDRALDLDVIDSFEPLDLSSNRAGRNCLHSYFCPLLTEFETDFKVMEHVILSYGMYCWFVVNTDLRDELPVYSTGFSMV